MASKGDKWPELMDALTASSYLSVAEKTLYRLIREKNIPATKLGREWRFKKSLLDQWLESQMGRGGEPPDSIPSSDDPFLAIPDPVRQMIRQAVQKLKTEYHPDRVILYGSYAYGRPTEHSDIDLFIVRETVKKRVDRFVEASRILYQPGQSVSISPMVYTPQEVDERLAMGDDFVREVMTRGKVLYG